MNKLLKTISNFILGPSSKFTLDKQILNIGNFICGMAAVLSIFANLLIGAPQAFEFVVLCVTGLSLLSFYLSRFKGRTVFPMIFCSVSLLCAPVFNWLMCGGRQRSRLVEHVTKKCTGKLEVKYGSDIPHVKGNIQYIEQVIINLVKNACQALPSADKGVFVATAFDEKVKEVNLSIRDEGQGMDEETLKNIFTPFYTTKGIEGTGLGLSICNNIVKSHGGRIEVESKVAEGTTIRVFIPINGNNVGANV